MVILAVVVVLVVVLVVVGLLLGAPAAGSPPAEQAPPVSPEQALLAREATSGVVLLLSCVFWDGAVFDDLLVDEKVSRIRGFHSVGTGRHHLCITRRGEPVSFDFVLGVGEHLILELGEDGITPADPATTAEYQALSRGGALSQMARNLMDVLFERMKIGVRPGRDNAAIEARLSEFRALIERCDDGASATLLAEAEELGASLNGLTLYAEDLMTFDALMPATDAASELAIARRVWPRMYSAQR